MATPSRRRPRDLRSTLLWGFGLLAILPMVIAVVLMTRLAEKGIAGSTDDVARISRQAITDTSDHIGTLASQQLQTSGQHLDELGAQAVRHTADTLLSLSEKQLRASQQQLIAQGEGAVQRTSQDLIQQSRKAAEDLTDTLIAESQQSNRELARETTRLAAEAIASTSARLVSQLSKSRATTRAHIEKESKASAAKLGETVASQVQETYGHNRKVDASVIRRQVETALDEMGSNLSQYVMQRLETERLLMDVQANLVGDHAAKQLAATSHAVELRTAAEMRHKAAEQSARTLARMEAGTRAVSAATEAQMRERSAAIAQAALAAMRPVGERYASQVEREMKAQSEQSLAMTARTVPHAAEQASHETALRLAGQSRLLKDRTVRELWLVAVLLLGVEVLLAAFASLLLSGRIAAPILTEQENARKERERLSRELEIAAKIQTCLLPPIPQFPDFDLSLGMMPAEEVGGDFVEFLGGAEPGSFWIGVGDVTGHGLTPGLIMMMAQSTFSSLSDTRGMTPKGLYDGMNRVLFRNIKHRLKTDDHMTMSVLKHEGEGRFVHCGSHLDVLVYRAAGERVERIVTEGPWVGMLPECEDFTEEIRFELADDDVLLLYTDGLIEVQNAQNVQWDMERLCESLSRHARLPAAEIQTQVLADCLRWADRVLDDISVVVVKRGESEVHRRFAIDPRGQAQRGSGALA